MQFKRAAGIYVAGICLILGGPLLTYISTTFGTWHLLRTSDHSLDEAFIAIGVFGPPATIVGFSWLLLLQTEAWSRLMPSKCGFRHRAGKTRQPSTTEQRHPALASR
ncbi:hypothetical protein NG702_18180 [Pseudarthrobacter sp. MDT3-28]|uniref:hypothetical protein n=1 Tax=Pseudarthrobacter raffinosi TaxID=2953651 RepID=UPI00208F4B3A|nr:hypothetical protein [Pseudarthrobacter sp. MDT3-28]MCO4239308.1 hypothetical protein [Pseudarthrobacter sp. MDT3-28]